MQSVKEKIKCKISLSEKIIQEARKEYNKEREEKYKERAKSLLTEIMEAKRTVDLLERQLKNFLKEIDLNN